MSIDPPPFCRFVASPALAVLLLASALGAVWWPVLSHYHVPTPVVPAEQVERHSRVPSDETLAEIAEQSLIADHPIGGEQAVVLARRILHGRLELPHSPPLDIRPGFSLEDLGRGNGWQQLGLASLIVPDLLLRAFETTGDTKFLDAARTYVLHFVEVEAGRFLPRGELWNGHAIATRVGILARFWKAERRRVPMDDRMARLVLAHVVRCAELLSKPSMFVVATNHGVMHNVGLLQVAVAFPGLPRAAEYRRLAIARLHEQMGFYVNGEGVVLEHSAGYHFHGVVMLSYVVRLLEMLGEPVPKEWLDKRDAAMAVFARLQRPDGTLPSFGNTMTYRWRLPAFVQGLPVTARSRRAAEGATTTLYPVAGYAIASDQARVSPPIQVQTVVPWSRFGGHGHANAQEMSLLIWADGVDWITNSRYWPTDAQWGERQARGWAGGNAPHVVGEAADGERETVLLASADARGLRVLDLQRRHAAEGVVVRRQIVQLGATRWLVFDSYADPARRPLRVLWSTYPGVAMSGPEATPGGEGQRVELRRNSASTWLSLEVRPSTTVAVHSRLGERDPFAGWVSVDRSAVPTHALDVRLASPDAWMLSLLRLQADADAPPDEIVSVDFDGADQWSVELRASEDRIRIARDGAAMKLTTTASDVDSMRSVPLDPGSDVGAARSAIAAALAAVRHKYPRYRDIEPYRVKASVVLVGSWAALQLVLLLIGTRTRQRTHALRALATGVWAVGGAWVIFGYLAV